MCGVFNNRELLFYFLGETKGNIGSLCFGSVLDSSDQEIERGFLTYHAGVFSKIVFGSWSTISPFELLVRVVQGVLLDGLWLLQGTLSVLTRLFQENAPQASRRTILRETFS